MRANHGVPIDLAHGFTVDFVWKSTSFDRMQAKALKDGTLSDAERAKLNAAQNKVSADINAEKHDAQTGNPNSASSRRMQADVARNIKQEKRIQAGVQNGSLTNDRLTHHGWTVAASWLLTGEDASFRSVTPKKNFDPHANGWGALQFVARYSVLDVDNDAFPTFADPAESATRANAWGFGLNWYLNRNVRASLNFIQTDFKGGTSGAVTRQNENVFLTRMQLAF